MSVIPITPAEAAGLKLQNIPDSIIKSVNEMIIKRWDGSGARVTQDELLKRILDNDPSLTREGIFKDHLLDFEPLFREAGWVVKYDKPGYNEDYGAYFVFEKKG